MNIASSKDVFIPLISVVVGALIPIIPSIINKIVDNKAKIKGENRNLKIDNYVELINLITFLLKNPNYELGFESLIAKINVVNLIGSAEVVECLHEYTEVWGKENNQEEQRNKYFKLLIAMRKDLKIEDWNLSGYQEIGLIDVMKKSD